MFQQFDTLQEYRAHQARKIIERRIAEDRRKRVDEAVRSIFERRSGDDRRG